MSIQTDHNIIMNVNLLFCSARNLYDSSRTIEGDDALILNSWLLKSERAKGKFAYEHMGVLKLDDDLRDACALFFKREGYAGMYLWEYLDRILEDNHEHK